MPNPSGCSAQPTSTAVTIEWSMPGPTGSQFRPPSRLRMRPARAVPQYRASGHWVHGHTLGRLSSPVVVDDPGWRRPSYQHTRSCYDYDADHDSISCCLWFTANRRDWRSPRRRRNWRMSRDAEVRPHPSQQQQGRTEARTVRPWTCAGRCAAPESTGKQESQRKGARTSSKTALASSPAPITSIGRLRPIFATCSGGKSPKTFAEPARIIMPAIKPCSTQPPTVFQFLVVVMVLLLNVR